MNWTKLKTKYLFHFNFTILLGIMLYGLRKDFNYHYVLTFVLLGGFFSKKVILFEERTIQVLGKINSTLILVLAFYLILTPYSLIYRMFYRKKSFQREGGRFVAKNSIASFDNPF